MKNESFQLLSFGLLIHARTFLKIFIRACLIEEIG